MQRSSGTRMTKMMAGPVRAATSSLPGNASQTLASMMPMPPEPGQPPNPKEISQEFSLRVPDVSHKQVNLMRFNEALKVDFAKWTSVKMQREDNSALHKAHEFQQLEMPKFGAGSEYGREAREEARRRKYGMNRKKYKPEEQPWILKESSKKYKGLREGGVNENASYYIFTQAPNGVFEVFPIKQWFNFTTIARYKSLTAEEAEEQFSKRHKVVNHFSIMLQKRLRDDGEGGGDLQDEDKKSKKGKGDMMITDMEDWVDDDGLGDEDSDDEDAKEKKKKKAAPVKKKKKNDSDDDPVEESDDGDEEGREMDYTSDSSVPTEDEDDKKPELSGVDQEGGLKSLLESESSSEEEKEKEKEEEKKVEDVEKKKKSKKKKKTKSEKKEEDEVDAQSAGPVADELGEDSLDVKTDASNDAVDAPVKEESSLKRKASFDFGSPASKKMKAEVPSSTLQLAASEGITEDAVRKYLLRKPMTIAELLQKFKPKKSKIGSNDLVPVIAHILKKLNPTKRTQQNKMYFFLNKD